MKSLKRCLFTTLCVFALVSCKTENKEASTTSTDNATEETERTGQAFMTDDEGAPNCLQIAIGSAYEIETQLLISSDLKFIQDIELKSNLSELNEIIKMISKFKSTLT